MSDFRVPAMPTANEHHSLANLCAMTKRNVRAARSRSDEIAFWWDIGIHSYIVARTAADWNYWQVAGRNAHFGVELMLKYLLVLPELWQSSWPNRGKPAVPSDLITHDLMLLWQRLDGAYPKHPLSEFTAFVEALNRWEEIRYAQYAPVAATVFATSMEAGANTIKANPLKTADVFVLDVAELDRFFRALMDFIGITTNLRGNRMWFGKGYDAYARDNPFAIA